MLRLAVAAHILLSAHGQAIMRQADIRQIFRIQRISLQAYKVKVAQALVEAGRLSIRQTVYQAGL